MTHEPIGPTQLATVEAPPTVPPTDLVHVARIIDRTRTEGPGLRTAIWVQGCSIRCPGCFNPHLWTSRGGRAIPPRDLAAHAVSARTDGVTLLGGEPFDQAFPLAQAAAAIRDSGATVVTFTGYTIEELRHKEVAGDAGVSALLQATDLLIDGPYLAGQLDRVRPWVGSINQRFHYLSPRLRWLREHLAGTPDRLEVRIAPTGEVSVNGWADRETLDAVLDAARGQSE